MRVDALLSHLQLLDVLHHSDAPFLLGQLLIHGEVGLGNEDGHVEGGGGGRGGGGGCCVRGECRGSEGPAASACFM